MIDLFSVSVAVQQLELIHIIGYNVAYAYILSKIYGRPIIVIYISKFTFKRDNLFPDNFGIPWFQ